MDDHEFRRELLAELTGPGGQYEIGTAVVGGRSCRVYLGGPASIRDVLVAGRRWGSRPALTYENERYSWAELIGLTARFAAALVHQYGIGKGDRVAIAMRNYPEWVVSFAATVSVGAVCVSLNAWWSGTELAAALDNSGATLLVADYERAARIEPERAGLPALRHVVEVRPGRTTYGDAEWSAVLAAHHDEFDLTAIPIDPDDDVTIMYTSGTTGTAKGAVATNRAHLTTMLNMQVHGIVEGRLAQRRGEPVAPPVQHPVSLVPGPLFHVSGLPRVVSAANTGVHLVLMYKWDARRVVELILRERIDGIYGGVPTAVRQLLDEIDASAVALPSLRTITTGGAQVTSALVHRIGSALDGRLRSGTGYGLTETTGAMMMIGSHDYYERPLSVGREFPTTEMRVVGFDGADVEPDDVGEAWLRGPNLARGYWGRQADAFGADGWFRTGDLVRKDGDGFVYIVDRIKDVVIRAGENVYCTEVEETLGDHPAVRDCSVLGVPHDLWGEEVVAVVQLRADAPATETQLRQYLQDRLAAFKVPTFFVLQQEELPRNAAGKVLKRALRDRIAGDRVTTT